MVQALITIGAVGVIEAKLCQLGYNIPWSRSSIEFWKTVEYIQLRDFHCMLDKLQQLVVQQLFELSKANIVGLGRIVLLSPVLLNLIISGYKMHTQIWKALKVRAKTIWKAMKKYNALALAMVPPTPVLQWKDSQLCISLQILIKHRHT